MQRSRSRRIGIAAAASFVAALLLTPRAEIVRACSCLPTNKTEQRERSGAVFLGEVLSFRGRGGGCARAPEVSGRVARLRVVRVWKGALRPGAEVAVTTGMNSADCGVEFVTGRSYMVYATTPEGESALATNLCTTTREVSAGVADPDTLGAPID
jgi:hypothetical protein